MDVLWFFVWYWCVVLVRIRGEPLTKWEQLLWTAKNSSKWSRNQGNVSSGSYKAPARLVLTPPSFVLNASTPEDQNSSTELFPNDSLNEYYRIHYGTDNRFRSLDGLERSNTDRKRNPVKDPDYQQAVNHHMRIKKHYPCKKPSPRVVKVQMYHPKASTRYYPRCTVLHQCDDSTGCCLSDNYHCAPLKSRNVTLRFFAVTVGTGITEVVPLSFENHTACHCEPVNDMPRISRQSSEMSYKDENLVKYSDQRRMKCRECPVPFTSRTYKDGRCGCDCFDRQKTCLRIKKGREALCEVERRCVETKYCHIPDCEHGVFDPTTGFCPKRHDEIQRTRPIRHSNYHYRWTFPERD